MIGFPKYLVHIKIIFVFLFTLQILNQNSFAITNQIQPDSTTYTYVDIKAGDLCIVCDMPINSESGIAFLFKGRRVTIDLAHFKDFIENPEKYFYKLQPNVALYSEGVFNKYQINYGWFVFGLWVLLALVSAAFCVNIAMKKGLSIKKWFYIGLGANIFGLIYLMSQFKNQIVELPEKFGKIPRTETPLICTSCGVYVHPSANKCNSCGNVLKSISESEIRKI